MEQKSMLVLSKLHQGFSWSSLGFSGSSYHLVDWHLFFAFILVAPMWTSFTVYLLCWLHSGDSGMIAQGGMENSDPKPKNKCEPAGMQLSWTTKRIWNHLASLNPSFPLMLTLTNRILSAGNILGDTSLASISFLVQEMPWLSSSGVTHTEEHCC